MYKSGIILHDAGFVVKGMFLILFPLIVIVAIRVEEWRIIVWSWVVIWSMIIWPWIEGREKIRISASASSTRSLSVIRA